MTIRYPEGVQETKQMGRPRVADPMEPVMTRLPTPVYDELCRRARGQGEPLSVIVRNLIVMQLKTDFS